MLKKIVKIVSFFIVLILGISFCSTYFDNRSTYIDKVLDVSRTVTPTQFNKVENLLIDYTVDNDIKKTIEKFLQQAVGQKNDTFIIQESFAGAPQEGASGDRLFFIRDKQDNLKFVVKVFSKPFDSKGNFIKELAGFGLISKLHGKNFHLVAAEAVGKSIIDGEKYGLLAITPANGINMQNLVIDILRLPKGTPERSNALHIAQKGIEKLGAALAEFHQIRTLKDMPLHPEITKRIHRYLNQVIEHLEQENPSDIEVQALQNYVASLVYQMKKLKTTRSIIHGDAHLGNFLYDAKTNTVSMVDYNELDRSVDEKGDPIGYPAIDVMSILDFIASNKQFGLTLEEANILSESFVKGYGSLPVNIEQEFFALLSHLNFISWFWGMKKANQEQLTNDKLKKVSIHMLDEIKKSLMNFQKSDEL